MTKIELVVACTDLHLNKNKFLLDDYEVPSIDIDVKKSKQPHEVARDIIKEYLFINPDWPDFKLCDCYVKDKSLRIVYGIMVPHETKLEKGEWYDLERINTRCDELVKKILYEASLKV